MSANELQTEFEGPIAKFIINRPDRLNSLTIGLAKTIYQEFLSLENRKTVKVLVISGSGSRAFSAGGDVSEFANASSGAEYIHDLTGHLHAIVEAFRESRILIIASIRGAVAGAGMGLCLATDFRIASEKTLFNLAFINLALSPDTSSTFFLPRLVGWSAAAKIALLGERIEAKEAGELGLVHYVVEDEDLESQTEKLALRCSNSPSLGIKRTKQLLNQSFNSTLTEQLRLERKYVVECANTDDFQEGLQAFLEKRRPNFQ